jgi:hypothetical protein
MPSVSDGGKNDYVKFSNRTLLSLKSVTKVQRYEILEGFISVLAPDRERKSGWIVPGFERVIGDFSCFVKDRHIREIGLKIFPRVP